MSTSRSNLACDRGRRVLVGSPLAPLITELTKHITRAAVVVSDWINPE